MLIERAQAKKVRVRDVLREMVGLDSALADERPNLVDTMLGDGGR